MAEYGGKLYYSFCALSKIYHYNSCCYNRKARPFLQRQISFVRQCCNCYACLKNYPAYLLKKCSLESMGHQLIVSSRPKTSPKRSPKNIADIEAKIMALTNLPRSLPTFALRKMNKINVT